MRQRNLRPYLEVKSGGGANYLPQAIQSWGIIFLAIYFLKGFFTTADPGSAIVVGTPMVPYASAGQMVPGVGTAMVQPLGTADPVDSFVQTQLAIIALSATPTLTPTPTLVPTNTPSPTVEPELLMFKLSFYDPEICRYFNDGSDYYVQLCKTNCADYDFDNQTCKSLTSSGDVPRLWYGRGVACPPPLQEGDIIEVVFPTQLEGRWTCIDRGGEIVNGYLDFLIRYPDMIWTGYNLNDFPWSSTVQAYHIHP